MHNVPGAHTIDEVLDGAAPIDTDQCQDKGGKNSGVCRVPVFLINVP